MGVLCNKFFESYEGTIAKLAVIQEFNPTLLDEQKNGDLM